MLANVTFTFVTLISSSLTILVATILFLILSKHLRRQRDISILLIANTYFTMIVFAAVILSTTVNVLNADLYGASNLTEHQLIGCRFQGFLMFETFGCFNMSFTLQALYRFVRVVYAKHRSLQSFSFNILLIILQWILFFLLLLPSYLWPGPLYSFYQTAYYCGILFEKLPGICYTVLNIYVFPNILLTIIYSRLMHFIHHQTPQLAQTRQGQRAQRDLLITRRILFTVTTLALHGIPNIGFVVLVNINRSYSGDFFMYRIEWMGPSITVLVLSIALIFMTPKIRKIFRKTMPRGISIAPTTMKT